MMAKNRIHLDGRVCLYGINETGGSEPVSYMVSLSRSPLAGFNTVRVAQNEGRGVTSIHGRKDRKPQSVVFAMPMYRSSGLSGWFTVVL